MNDENELFLKHMKGVTQIKKKNNVSNTPIIKKNKRTSVKQETKTKTIPETTTIITNTKNPPFSLERVNIKKNIKKNI